MVPPTIGALLLKEIRRITLREGARRYRFGSPEKKRRMAAKSFGSGASSVPSG
jgi:hypothetical protein